MEMKQAIYNLITILDQFFKEESAISFNMCIWKRLEEEQIYKPRTVIEIPYSYKININNCLIEGGKTSLLYKDIFFAKDIMGFQSVHQLSSYISMLLNEVALENEEMKYLNLFTGLNFHSISWEEIIEKNFGYDSLKSFRSKKLYNQLENELLSNEKGDKKTKL